MGRGRPQQPRWFGLLTHTDHKALSPTPSPAAREGQCVQLLLLNSNPPDLAGTQGLRLCSFPGPAGRASWSLAQSPASARSWQGAAAGRQLGVGGAELVAASPHGVSRTGGQMAARKSCRPLSLRVEPVPLLLAEDGRMDRRVLPVLGAVQ